MNMERVLELIEYMELRCDDDALFQIATDPKSDEAKFAAVCLLMASPSNERKAE